ncbi:MAG: hypothetical protein Q9164_005049 [Protoblastenia rupestris]
MVGFSPIRIRYWLRQDLLSSDKLLEQTQKLLAREVPRQDDTLNLQNWVDNTSCLAEKETRYLLQYEDLTTLYSPGDDALARLNPAIEALLRALYRLLKKVDSPPKKPQSGISKDPNISIMPASTLQKLGRLLVAWVVLILLLVPVVVVNALGSTALRLVVIACSSTGLITILSWFTNAKAVEVLVCGAT